MKLEKFPNRVQSIIEEFDEIENKKRFRILITLNNEKTLVCSRLTYNENNNEATIKYSAQSKRSFTIQPCFIERISDIQIEKVSVIRKKLKLRAPIKKRAIERDKFGIPIKKSRKIRKDRELSELEFKAMFDERFISNERRDELFGRKNLSGGMDIPKKAFKKIPPEFQPVVNEFLEKYVDLETVTDDYKRDNYGGLSLIVGHTFTNERQLDPRFKAYKSFTVIHRAKQDFIKIVKNNVKQGRDTFYYLINPYTMVQVHREDRWRNRG
jgi:hypothetical protein